MQFNKYTLSTTFVSVILIICSHFLLPGLFQLAENEEETTDADKQMESWWWSRGYPDPENVNSKFIAGWHQSQIIRQQTSRYKGGNSLNGGPFIASGFGDWASIGPTMDIGGRSLSIAINPVNSNQIFIGTAGGGIWRTENAGNLWEPVVTGFPVIGVPSIIINPLNPQIIYAGTGEVYRVDTTGIGYNVWKTRGTYGAGILKSVDGGISWSQVLEKSLGDLFGVQHLEFHPEDAEIVFACCTDGLYKTMDGGNSWNKILNTIYARDIAINNLNSNEMIVAVGNLVNSDKGLYKTTDGGENWTKIASAAFPKNFNGLISVEANGNLIYAGFGTDGNSSTNELCVSADFGNSWILKNNSNLCSYQYWYCNDIAIDPSNPNRLLMCGVNMYNYDSQSSSTAAGRATQILNIHSDIHDILYDPKDVNVAYLATDGGMYKSTDNGASFTPINNGLAATQFYASLGVSPTKPDDIIGGLQDNGVVKYDGVSWKKVVGGDGGSTSYNPANENIVLTNTQYRAVYRSTNGGLSFTTVLNNWASDRCAFIAPMAISKVNPNFVFSATDVWHTSTNGGVSFSNNNQNLTNYIEARNKTAITIAASPINSEKAVVSTSPFSQRADNALNVKPPPNLFKTINASASNPVFINIKGNLPDRFVLDACYGVTNDDSIFVTLGGYGTSHIYVTGDGGISWTSVGEDLPDVPFNAIIIDPINPQIIYAGCDLGVYVSNNRGATWFDFNNGFWDATIVYDLQITADKKLVCATHGKGVFKTDLLDESVLPVRIYNFTGIKQNDGNLLEWSASQENRLSHYIIERSENGSRFERIGEITVQNTPVASYKFKDAFTNAKNPIYFYRLRMVNSDGSFNYSSVVSVSNFATGVFKVLANPFVSNITVQCYALINEPVQLYLYDMNGRLIKTQNSMLQLGTNIIQIPHLSSLPHGSYSLLVLQGSNIYKAKLMK